MNDLFWLANEARIRFRMEEASENYRDAKGISNASEDHWFNEWRSAVLELQDHRKSMPSGIAQERQRRRDALIFEQVAA